MSPRIDRGLKCLLLTCSKGLFFNRACGGNSNTPLSSDSSNILSSSGGGYYRDFTPTELDTNSRNAKSKYDTQTYRRWKRAKKKAK